MTRFVIEKLPSHWLFVPPKRQIRELLVEIGADVRMVEVYGTGYGRGEDRVSLGFVESRVVEGRWSFYLRLWGVREAEAVPIAEQLAAAALAEIGHYIRECLSKVPADVTKPAQMSLSFRTGGDRLTSECRVKVVDRYSYSTRVWWVSESET